MKLKCPGGDERGGTRRWAHQTGAALSLAAVLTGAAGTTSASSRADVTLDLGQGLSITTPVARFTVDASGHVSAGLRRGDAWLSLDDAAPPGGDQLRVGDEPLPPVAFDLAAAQKAEAFGPLGPSALTITLRGQTVGAGARVEKTLILESYDDFPGLLVARLHLRNTGPVPVIVDRLVLQSRRLSAGRVDPSLAPSDLWHFAGASRRWGEDDVLHLAPGFARENLFAVPAGEAGGGVPVAAFWTAQAGTALGILEPHAVVSAIPVRVGEDGRIATEAADGLRFTLLPGQLYEAPRSFVAVFAGDYFEPLRTYSLALSRMGWKRPRPSDEAYAPAWCGWGYEFDVTPGQMLGTVPKLEALGIHWATLDDRWFDRYGDWNPRRDTFPGDALRRMVDAFHAEGIRVQLWWYPLAAEDEVGQWPSHVYSPSRILGEHPDWFVLDRQGRRARVARNLAVLCPALPEVRAYFRALTERFVRDWDVDGHKLDVVYAVPPCFNPAHDHRRPEDSIDAMAEVYRDIFETTRRLKPEAVTQICPCGTPPNAAWLPYMDQAVTADPLGAIQVRRRIKMYKALLGPAAPVYGDHVELTASTEVDGRRLWVGRDFASTVGLGGVPGTKFIWPRESVGALRFDRPDLLFLSPEKEAHWKKWLDLYTRLQLSRGTYRNLYATGYDVPEGHAVEKDGRMYYAFFAPEPDVAWSGEIELRGLTAPGRYRVRDYVAERDLGSVDAARARLAVRIEGSLLLVAERE